MIERMIAIGLTILLAGCAKQEPAGDLDENFAAGAPSLAPATPGPTPAKAGREPIGYTSLKAEDCRVLEENRAEAGYSLRACSGLAGYTLETSESDLRQDIVVVAPDGTRTELELSSKIANGAFNAIGERAEWRGSNPASPTALIIRLGVANGAEPNRPDTSNLLVVRLAPPACVVAVIPPGPTQNEDARDKTDTLPAACL